MYITRVRLKDIKGFSGARAVDLTLTRPSGSQGSWTVLAGRNGSGKTTLLRAIALAISGPETARSLTADYRNWVTEGAKEARAMVGVWPAPEDVWIDEEGDRVFMVEEAEFALGLTWSVPADHHTPSEGRDIQPSMGIDLFTRQLAQEGPWQENPRGWFCAAYGPFRRLSGAVEPPGARQGLPQVTRLASLFQEDASLAEGVRWLVNQHLRALEGKPGAAELKSAALSVLGDGLLPDQYQVSDADSDGLWVAKGGNLYPLREMSDAYRTVTALVVDLLKQIYDAFGELPFEAVAGVPTITAPGIVIIDEVDAHLHISWQKRIGSWLKTHFSNVQFIVTTHSPYICQDADPGGLIRLPGPEEHARPEVVSVDLWERVVYGSGDDAVISELFGIDTTYSESAQRLRRELVALEVKVIKGTADEVEIARFRKLKEKLTSSTLTRSRELGASLRDLGAADE
jgi:energy-coupling factor transporter ATP-binding protein EcfA2